MFPFLFIRTTRGRESPFIAWHPYRFHPPHLFRALRGLPVQPPCALAGRLHPISALAQRIFRLVVARLGGSAATRGSLTVLRSMLNSTLLAASRIFCLGVKTIFGVLRASATVTSSGVSIILEGTTRRNEPSSARSTLMPSVMASHTTLERLMRAFLTSPSDSEVSRTMRSMSILFVKYCCVLGWAKYTVSAALSI